MYRKEPWEGTVFSCCVLNAFRGNLHKSQASNAGDFILVFDYIHFLNHKQTHTKMKKQTLVLGLWAIAMLTGCIKEINPVDQTVPQEQVQVARNSTAGWEADADFVPGELLIKFKAGTPQTGRANALLRISGKIKEHIVTAAMKAYGDGEGLHIVSVPNGVLEAIDKLKDLAEVEYAEPNYIYRHGDPVPRDLPIEVSYSDKTLWGMYSDDKPTAVGPAGTTNPYGSQAEKAWYANHTGAKEIAIGIIDEGIKYDHPDLDANIWKNPMEVNGTPGVDDDRNGYIDDVYGWDFANNDNQVYDGTGLDNHGTHVAGTIGAKANNEVIIDGINHNQGVVGVNWTVTMISGKFLGANGGTTANAIKAIDYITDLKIRHGLNLVATNNSWGGGGFSQALLDAITRGAKQNILFIAAAGNGNMVGIGQNNDKKANYPSNYSTLGQTGGASSSITLSDGSTAVFNSGSKCDYDAVIAVAAIDNSGRLAGFSNYGAKTVDLGAPGVGIWSTVGPPDNFAGYSGTSMATPHVTGGAALYAATHSERGAALKEVILNAAKATPTSSLSGKTVTGGRLNVGGF